MSIAQIYYPADPLSSELRSTTSDIGFIDKLNIKYNATICNQGDESTCESTWRQQFSENPKDQNYGNGRMEGAEMLLLPLSSAILMTKKPG